MTNPIERIACLADDSAKAQAAYAELKARYGFIDIAGKRTKPDVIVASFHGLPLINCQKGDTYYCHSHKTARLLAGMTDSRGSPLQVVRIPSPGLIRDADGEIIPASHMNFLIANGAVIVPIYAEESGAFAVEVIKGVFPERQVIGLPSTAILTGGGSFHCISQQEPV